MQVGWVKIGDFRQIAGYISKKVQDRHIVSIKVVGLFMTPETMGADSVANFIPSVWTGLVV